MTRSSGQPMILAVGVAGVILSACAVNRPVALSPEPGAMADFIVTHHPTDVFVTDTSGRSRVVHDPRIDGDSLRGLRNRDLPRLRLSIPLNKVKDIAVPQFSTGRTLALAGTIVVAAAVSALVLLSGKPDW